ncbi:cation diffusion facilitator family transporter [Candidatus Chlorohelix allophototropha]|uniref:Cation diffusion facilitator family transporter n=1 Tax=Candidatus Chlorohelix allophototropha TaxID=3003348 RepID=A0ABY9B2H8_9CHLR|nr:cation diffusion facilitator family transporter [Chloroflexota bacterium L227-S17]
MENNKLKFIYLSLATSFATITLKAVAFLLTGSVSLLSDAMESIVNVVAAFTALIALKIAARPPDKTHQYGHEKAEFFSSAIEGGLILVAAFAIVSQAIPRLFNPKELESLGWGLGVSMAATLLNFIVARTLITAGRKHDSIALEADGKHLMTDVVTSVGVVIGLLIVLPTNWLLLDPIIAILVACNIIFEGGRLIMRSVDGLMDKTLPESEIARINKTINEVVKSSNGQVNFHNLRTRKSGGFRFAELHLLTPGNWSVLEAHQWSEEIQEALGKEFSNIRVSIHEEPIEDPRAHSDSWS